MNKKSIINAISILGTACITVVAVQAFYATGVDVDLEKEIQHINLNLLPSDQQGLQAHSSTQMLANTARINQLKQQLADIKNTLNQSVLPQHDMQSEFLPDDLAEEEIFTGVTLEEPVEDRQFVDHFATTLANEVSHAKDDQESTSKIEQSFEESLELRNITGVSLLSSECKATLCKIELGFDDDATREQLSGLGISIIPWDGQAFYHQSETEPNTMIYYIAKEGYELAMPESSNS